jgi:hypothetical protein
MPRSIQPVCPSGVTQQTAGAGKVVIVAHAASIALAGDDRVFRVLVTASPEVRSGRLLQTEQLDEHEAAKRIDRSDKERAAYIKRFYGSIVSFRATTTSSLAQTISHPPSSGTRSLSSTSSRRRSMPIPARSATSCSVRRSASVSARPRAPRADGAETKMSRQAYEQK